MTLTDAYAALGQEITRLANAGKIDGDKYHYNRRAGMARAILRAAAEDRVEKAARLGALLSGPRDLSPAAPKSWRPVAELAWRLGRQVRQAEQDSQRRAA